MTWSNAIDIDSAKWSWKSKMGEDLKRRKRANTMLKALKEINFWSKCHFQRYSMKERQEVHRHWLRQREEHPRRSIQESLMSITRQGAPTILSCIQRSFHSNQLCRLLPRVSVSWRCFSLCIKLSFPLKKCTCGVRHFFYFLFFLSKILLLAHFLPRPAPEPLAATTGKEDEVTSSEEASSVARRNEPKGKNLNIFIFH